MRFFGGKRSDDEQLPVTDVRIPTPVQRKPEMDSPRTPEVRRVQLNDSPTALSKKASISKSQKPKRVALVRTPSVQTRYMDMLLHLDQIPRFHNILASFCTWILLAGFIVFPGTFTSLRDAADEDNGASGQLEHKILHTVSNLPLLWIAGACCVVGGIGMVGLWIRWRQNYVWLINKIFLPGALNSVAGLISTVVNVYTAQDHTWSVTAKITAIVTGACTGVTVIFFALYNHWILARVRKSHQRDMQLDHQDESVGEKAKRIATEPALEPGSVI